MTDELLSVQNLRDNVAKSRGHIVKQDAIIARLLGSRNDEMATQASAILVTMHEHLELEVEMLARREAQEAGSSS